MAYHDTLEPLNRNIPLKEKLQHCHRVVNHHMPFVARIAVALYDPGTATLKTYVHSSGEDDPLSNYTASLNSAPSLKRILEEGRPRVINEMVTHEEDQSIAEHRRRLGRQGYAASYTLPMFDNGNFAGFIFFNSYQRNVFEDRVLHELDVFGHLISLMVISELTATRSMIAALHTASHITHQRDPETGSHLDRMSRYSRLIAEQVADKYGLNDEFIEHVFMFAPLHDIGKVAIPDSILFKPGPLDSQERAVMDTHSRKGAEIIDQIIADFCLHSMQHVDVLRNIALYHHEKMGGQGYPEGLRADQIPIEARIVAVADVFDALTSKRPYKEAWGNDKAFATLLELAGDDLDRDCVQALLANRERVEAIQKRFVEDPMG